MKVEQLGAVVKLSPSDRKDFVLFPFPAKGGEIYAVHLKDCSEAPISVHAWDVDNRFNKLGDLTLFNDTAPASPAIFSDFDQSFVVPALQGTGAAIALSLTDSEDPGANENRGASLPSMEVRDIQLARVATRREPYHRLEMGQSQTRTVFIRSEEHT